MCSAIKQLLLHIILWIRIKCAWADEYSTRNLFFNCSSTPEIQEGWLNFSYSESTSHSWCYGVHTTMVINILLGFGSLIRQEVKWFSNQMTSFTDSKEVSWVEECNQAIFVWSSRPKIRHRTLNLVQPLEYNQSKLYSFLMLWNISLPPHKLELNPKVLSFSPSLVMPLITLFSSIADLNLEFPTFPLQHAL